MTEVVAYSIFALLIVVLAGRLVRQSRRDDLIEADPRRDWTQGLLDESSLSLAERVFDPADYLWLHDKVCFPHLARLLARSRKEMALRWLKALRRSFDDLVRAPEPASSRGQTDKELQSWQLLWLILRFHFLLVYAVLVVRLLGPYHPLIPSFGWVRPIRERAAGKLAAKHLS